jgi:hypothetical protein
MRNNKITEILGTELDLFNLFFHLILASLIVASVAKIITGTLVKKNN